MGIVHLNRDATLLVSTLPWVPGPEAECGGVAEVQLLFAVDVDKSWRGRWAHRYQGTATSNARFWVWVHLLVNLVAMAFLFTMNLCLPWVLNFNLSQARLLKETACNYVFSVLVHGIPSISAWISIHQNSQKFFCAKTSIGH